MSRFRWNKPHSETAVVHATIIRITTRRMTLDEALRQTIPIHSKNPEAISERMLNGLRRRVQIELKRRNKGASVAVGQYQRTQP